MIKQLSKHGNFDGVAVGAIATKNIPIGGTIYGIFIRPLDGGVALTRLQMLTDIDNIVVEVDGVEIINASPDDILMLNRFYGGCDGEDTLFDADADTTSVIPIYTTRRNLPDDFSRSVEAWGTADVRNITVKVFINAAAANLDGIEVYTLRTSEVRMFGQHTRIKTYTFNYAGTGDFDIPGLPISPKTMGYRALHIADGSGTVTAVTLDIGTLKIHNNIPPMVNVVDLMHNRRTPQSGFYHLDLSRWDELLTYLPMADRAVTELRLTPSYSVAPDAFRVVTEQIFNLTLPEAA